MAKVFQELADERTTVMFHAEMVPSVADDVSSSIPSQEPNGPSNHYQTFLDSRPSTYETHAVHEILSLAHIAPKLPLHIVHLSAIEAIPLLREARAKGIPITAETCFHYLSLAAEEVAHGDTRHKCCPPIRSQSNQNGLWEELAQPDDSVIKTIVSDHSPCTPKLKLLPSHINGSVPPSDPNSTDTVGDFLASWGGISSVGLGLPILWTQITSPTSLPSTRSVTLPQVIQWCAVNTAAQVGLQHTKGRLAVGYDADVAVFDDVAEWIVTGKEMLFRNKCSPYEGRKMRGRVRETWVRGRRVWNLDEGFGKEPVGRLIVEERTS